MTNSCFRRTTVALIAGLFIMFSAANGVSAQKLGEVPRVEPSPKAPREEVLEWSSREGRPYWYRLPKSIRESAAPSLVLMLHGTGVSHGWAFWNYPIASGGFRPQDIVVAPEGMTPGGGTTFNFIQGAADGDHLAGLIREFKARFPIGNVYVYGHSQGAFFAYWFAGAHADLVDGIVAHAGNVLNVAFPKIAKRKVAIGILHGKADAVVPVDCAHRTEKIYRDQGYEKVKLTIVEGLTERSGHWPLPRQAGEMFEWLDRVSIARPNVLLDLAVAELRKEDPDLVMLVETTGRARDLMAKYREDDADALRSRLDSLDELLATAESAHIETLAECDPRAKEFEPWMAHFRGVHPAFAARKEWRRSLRSLVTSAKKDDAAVAKAIADLTKKPRRKAFLAATQNLERCRLASRVADLEAHMDRLASAPIKDLRPDDIEAFRAIRSARAETLETGEATRRAITRRVASEFLAKLDAPPAAPAK